MGRVLNSRLERDKDYETNFVLPMPKTEFKKRSFQYSAAHDWSSLSPQAKKATNLISFKKEIGSKCTLIICK